MSAIPTPTKPVLFALYLNAALLAGLLVAMLARGSGRSPFDSMAFGQPAPQPIAGGAGFYLMPAQFDRDHWGCYVMDVDAQTLIAYQYDNTGPGGQRNLRLVAARSFQYDRQLRSYNTLPKPDEVQQLINIDREGTTSDAPTNPTDTTSRPVIPNR